MRVTKRDGSTVQLDLERFHKVVSFACQGLKDVSASEVEIRSKLSFYDKIKTSDIQEALIRSAQELISEEHPNYQYVAGRLLSYHLRKSVYGKYEPDHLFDVYSRGREKSLYTSEIFDAFSEDEWDELNSYIKHDRDDTLTYIGMEQFRSKYLVRNRFSGDIAETPQIAFMLISMTFFMNDGEGKERLDRIKKFYDLVSTYKISLPTPIMAGMRGPDKQFSSCTVIEAGDDLDSINAASAAIVDYTANKAGIGIGMTRIRSLGDKVKGGRVTHTGKIPFIKLFEASINSVSQGGLRKASGNLNLLLWDLEVEELLVLKNNKGTEETRARGLDYTFLLNRVMYERLIADGEITLLSAKDHPEMYEAYFNDVDKFRTLYEKAEKSRCRKKTVRAYDLFATLLQERLNTGRIYILNVDNANNHSAYKDLTVYFTNLCCEINLVTSPVSIKDPSIGEIGLCTLAAINMGEIKKPEDFEEPMAYLVRALDNLLDYQDYPVEAARICGQKRRSLGIGITNLAYWLAKNGMTYSDPDLEKIHEFAEAYGFYALLATTQLAKERGPCELSHESANHNEFVITDTYNRGVDSLVPNNLKKDWDILRGLPVRNYPLLAGMPCETSSAVSGGTNGFEPAQAPVISKISKDINVKMVLPELKKLSDKYEYRWDIESNKGYLSICAVFQKFMDQGISVNTNYNPAFYPDDEIPMSVMVDDLIFAYKNGIKALYYCNTNDGAGEIDTESCEGCTV